MVRRRSTVRFRNGAPGRDSSSNDSDDWRGTSPERCSSAPIPHFSSHSTAGPPGVTQRSHRLGAPGRPRRGAPRRSGPALSVCLSRCHLCWRREQPRRIPWEFFRHQSPFRVSAPHHIGAWNRKYPRAANDKAKITASLRSCRKNPTIAMRTAR